MNRSGLIASAVAALAIYALMWAGYAWNWAWLEQVDSWALAPMSRFGGAHPGWVTAWDVFCTVFGPIAFRVAVAVVIVLALIRRRFRIALFLLLTAEFGGVVTNVAKVLVDRPRPATALVSSFGSSFPSGHALGVMLTVLALLTVTLPVVRPSWRAWLIALGVALVVAIGVGRVVLNVHHPTDVIAGWALGYAYFTVCLLVVPPRRPVTQPDETPAARGIGR